MILKSIEAAVLPVVVAAVVGINAAGAIFDQRSGPRDAPLPPAAATPAVEESRIVVTAKRLPPECLDDGWKLPRNRLACEAAFAAEKTLEVLPAANRFAADPDGGTVKRN